MRVGLVAAAVLCLMAGGVSAANGVGIERSVYVERSQQGTRALEPATTLRKGDKVARCSLVTHPFGWELRLITTDLVRSQVCRTGDEILSTQEQWKAAMIEKGWSE